MNKNGADETARMHRLVRAVFVCMRQNQVSRDAARVRSSIYIRVTCADPEGWGQGVRTLKIREIL